MEISEETDDYIRESIDHCIGLPVSRRTLEIKLQVYEEFDRRLRDECSSLFLQSKEKDETIDKARKEASMVAVALKKFVEENQRLKNECKLYDHDREVLMEFGNEADQRAKEAESRVQDLEKQLMDLTNELESSPERGSVVNKQAFYLDDLCFETGTLEETSEGLLNTVLASVIHEDEVPLKAHAFLEKNSEVGSCFKLLKRWDDLMPHTRNILALIDLVRSLERDKRHLRSNLQKAEDEVKILFDENNVLDEENKMLMKRRYRKENKTTLNVTKSAPVKCIKRKHINELDPPVAKRIEFGEVYSPRCLLSSVPSRVQ